MTKKKDIFTEVYNNYFQLLVSSVYTKIEDVDYTMDICQGVFIKFYEKFETVENHRKWLNGTLKLELNNYYRKKNKKIQVDNLENINDVISDVLFTFANGFKDTRLIMQEAIKETIKDETDLILFDLVAIYNYTYSQTARELGLTKRKVEYRYTNIRKNILRYLERQKGVKEIEDLL